MQVNTRNIIAVSGIVLFISAVFLFSCSGDHSDNHQQDGGGVIGTMSDSYINRPAGGRNFVIGTSIPIELKLRKIPENLDSVLIYVDQRIVFSTNEKKESYQFDFSDSSTTCGTHQIKTVLKKSDGKREEQYQRFVYLSDVEPVQYTYNIVKKFPHDIHAYTQGLIIDNGILYEGTGLRGESQLRIVNMMDGSIMKSVDIKDNLFGEGITIIGDKIYQLTYQAHRGFVYDKKSFALLSEFQYKTEGWGITTNGSDLIYSDGSHQLFYVNPETFEVVKTIEVYDNHGMQTRLNELEYIEGEIWANVYTTDEILRIDPNSGKVTGKISCRGLLQPEEYKPGETDVLNGIAYDHRNKNIYITGKNWPWMFEVKIVRADS